MSDLFKKLGEKPPHLRAQSREKLVAAVVEVFKPVAPPSLDGLDNLELPPFTEALIPTLEDSVSLPALTFDASSGLSELTELAMERAKEILQFDLNEEDDAFLSVLRAQVSMITSVFTTQARVDETRLRARPTDSLPKLLELLREEKLKLPGAMKVVSPPLVH